MNKKITPGDKLKQAQATIQEFSNKRNERLKRFKLLNEFKAFINRGNIVDLAVGVIVGGAFSSIVTSLVNDIIMPITSLIIGGVDFTSLNWIIPNFFGGDTQATIAYGKFLQNLVNFLIIAACVFFFVRLLNKLQPQSKSTTKTDKADKAADRKTNDEQLKVMKEILAELKKQNKA